MSKRARKRKMRTVRPDTATRQPGGARPVAGAGDHPDHPHSMRHLVEGDRTILDASAWLRDINARGWFEPGGEAWSDDIFAATNIWEVDIQAEEDGTYRYVIVGLDATMTLGVAPCRTSETAYPDPASAEDAGRAVTLALSPYSRIIEARTLKAACPVLDLGEDDHRLPPLTAIMPETRIRHLTMRTLIAMFPQALWLHDGELREVVTTEELRRRTRRVPNNWQDRVDSDELWATLLDAPIRMRGMHVFVPYDESHWQWFTRIMSLGYRAADYNCESVRQALLGIPDEPQVVVMDTAHAMADWGAEPWIGYPAYPDQLANIQNSSEQGQSLADMILDQPGFHADDMVFVYDPTTPKSVAFPLFDLVPAAQPPALPTGWRSDAPLVKQIAKEYGLETARALQRLPLVSIPHPRDTLDDLRAITAVLPDMDRFPWVDVMLDLGWKRGIDLGAEETWHLYHHGHYHDVLRYWARITRLDEFMRTRKTLAPWCEPRAMRDEMRDHPENWLVVTNFTIGDGVLVGATVSVWPVWNWAAFALVVAGKADAIRDAMVGKPTDLPSGEDFKNLQAEMTGLRPMMAAADLVITDDYLVIETPKPTGAPPRQASAKPWTRTDLPRIVLMNPHKHVRREKKDPEGTHASPIRHLRRGCVSILLHPRFYQFPYNQQVRRVLTGPPPIETVVYERDGFLSGTDERGQPCVYARVSEQWVELQVRRPWRKEAWAGSREWEGPEKLYRLVEV